MRNVAKIRRLKLRAGDKRKTNRVVGKQRTRKRHVVDTRMKTLDEAPNGSKLHDSKQKKTLDVVLQTSRLRVEERKIANVERRKRRTRRL